MKKKTLIIILAIVLGVPFAILGGTRVLAVVAYFVASAAAKNQHENLETPRAATNLNIYAFPPFRANTSDAHRINLTLHAGYSKDSKVDQEIREREQQLVKIVNLILSGKTQKEVSTTVQQLELREEIKETMNHILSSGKVEEVYFLNFTID